MEEASTESQAAIEQSEHPNGECLICTPGQKLRLARQAAKLSQAELGIAVKVTTQFISNLERDVTPVPFEKVPALAAALKTTQNEMALYALESTKAFKTFLRYNI